MKESKKSGYSKLTEGDEVRFLDEKGEGIVTGFDRKGNALVQTSDGFVIPYLPAKLVVVGRKDALPETEVPLQSATKIEAISLGFARIGADKVQLNILNGLRNQFWLAVYSFSDRQYHLHGHYFLDQLQAISVASIPFTQLTLIDRFYLRVVPLPKEASFLPEMWSGYIRHQSPLLADTENWPWDQTGSYRMLQFPFYPYRAPAHQDVQNKDKVIQKAVINTPERRWLLQAGRDEVYEIDLHLEELLDSTVGMDNAEMIQYQLRHFERCLDEAIERKLRKFVAIHGVGKGRLREELRKILTSRNITHYDAPYNKYGYGATEVNLRG